MPCLSSMFKGLALTALLSSGTARVIDLSRTCHSVRSKACALSALEKICGKDALASVPTSWSTDIADVRPDAKHFADINIRELGIDELKRLIASAQEELSTRSVITVSETRSAKYTAPAFLALPATCSADGDDCRSTRCCTLDSQCFEKNADWATCAETCSLGIHANDPPEFQTPWTCRVLTKEAVALHPGNQTTSSESEAQESTASGNASCGYFSFPSGCGPSIIWSGSNKTVSFKNHKRAESCADSGNPSTVLLTVPKSFFSTPADLKKKCAGGVRGAIGVIELLLRDSWKVYQEHVGTVPMNQCFHGSKIASVKYLHMQSFCAAGNFHAMPNRDHSVGVCVVMSSLDEASALAPKLLAMMQ
eukprot:TRINITY_DN9006_c0_g1_i2.p1 TRINITY_DN9006_c0_g1~~TRINITY_DN9006_c0_g1_i2.p1  ORF type:complete len:364 (-),score=55.99 TRINITY_DN9006_c0_g1_i2:88-1179(-)